MALGGLSRIYFLFASRPFKNLEVERLFLAKYEEDGLRMMTIFFIMAGVTFWGFSVVELGFNGHSITELIQWVRPLVGLAFFIGAGTAKRFMPFYRRFYQPSVCVFMVIYAAFILWFEFEAQVAGHPEFFYLSVTGMCLLMTVSCYYFMHLSVSVAALMSGIFFAMSYYVLNISDVRYGPASGRMATYVIVANGVGLLMRQVADRKQRYLFLRQKRLREMTSVQARLIEAQAVGMQAKMRFLAMLSHEMRSPVNAVVRAMEALRRDFQGSLTENRVEMLKTVDRRCGDLLRIFDDLLDLGAMSERIGLPPPVRFSFPELVAHCVQLAETQAADKGLQVSVDIDPCVEGSYYVGHAPALKRILSNLLANAIKFTGEGLVSVSVEVLEWKGGYEKIQLLVADTGIGIASDELHNIFQPFYQVESSLSRRFGGNGLGLAICRQLAESMGATLTVDSEVGRGSTFKLTLTLSAEQQNAQARAN